ncbi:hypothetical protein CFC21_055347 [Triticum aestivum]|uniref:Pectinesterase inhibitor domain-containing protein n=2 Tax=Triticum aestivum TaxID=4565 RepID=A0A3B6I5H9_WHEAT|nr:uncharacterized protein LOC123084411 [Triticum aestivum]KAF7046314.1 hypothetical protein CFC21_055347 [Triticum aestivum]
MATRSTTTVVLYTIVCMLLSVVVAAQANDFGGGKLKETNLMVEACKNASSYSLNPDNVTQEFCLSTLQSNNRSFEAKDLNSLVLITIDILKGRITPARGKVEKMLQNAKKGTVTMRALSFCKLDYDGMVRVLNICDAMIRDYHGDNSGLPSFELPRCVERVMIPAENCGSELDRDMPGAEALVNENAELVMLVNLNYALLAQYDDN